MKLVMASYFEPETYGEGRKIGITTGKPRDTKCDFRFDALDPGQLYFDYKKDIITGQEFVEKYREQCEGFVEEVRKTASAEGKDVFDILPFEEEDNLLSWEHSGHLTFRTIAAEYLRELGYDVVER